MSAPRPPEDRVAYAKTQVGTTSWSGMCEAFVRTCVGFEAMYSSAHLAYQGSAAAGAVHVDYDAPLGLPVFFDITYGANAAYDHIALSSGGGRCYSTSAGAGGELVEVGIAELTQRWGMTYLGWAEVYHQVRLWPWDAEWEALMSWYDSKQDFEVRMKELMLAAAVEATFATDPEANEPEEINVATQFRYLDKITRETRDIARETRDAVT